MHSPCIVSRGSLGISGAPRQRCVWPIESASDKNRNTLVQTNVVYIIELSKFYPGPVSLPAGNVDETPQQSKWTIARDPKGKTRLGKRRLGGYLLL